MNVGHDTMQCFLFFMRYIIGVERHNIIENVDYDAVLFLTASEYKNFKER
jgi:hypothetical protein